MNTEISIPTFQNIEEAVSYGMDLREQADAIQWLYGDYAIQIELDLGRGAIEEVAKQLGLEANTFRRYRDVARKFPRDKRSEFPKLSWTFFRYAYSLPEPDKVLKQADDDNWTADKVALYARTKGNLPDIIKPKMIQCVDCQGWYLYGKPLCIREGDHAS
jgi:hypothetical protein